MAEALAAVGLASSIVAFVDFAQKVVSRLNEFSNDLRDGTNALFTIQTQLPVIIDGLRRIKERADSGRLDDGAKAALQPIVSACQAQVQLLNGILDSILPAADASKWERRRKAIQSLTADGQVKKASEILSRHLQTLTFYHSIGDPVPPQSVVKKVFWLVPFDRNGNFVGRESVFDQINEAFNVSEGSQPKAALYGLGGIGKSQIALEYCFRERHHQPECSIFWVNGATVARFEESFQLMAKEFGLSGGDNAVKDNLTSVKVWLETEFVDPWVMVIDNVDDETAFFREKCHNDKSPSQVLPHCSHGQLLFTSRTRDVAFDLASPETPISVDFLSTEEGLDLLRKRLGADQPESDLVELLTELGHIPLAITQAISFIVKRRKSVRQYLELYLQGEKSMSRLLSHEFLDHGRQEQTMESVARTWQISFEWIQKNDPNAAEILCLMGFYQHHGVPEKLLHIADVDDFVFEESIAMLQAFSLLEVDKERKSYSTHRLIQITTKLWLEQKELPQFEQWPLRALKQVKKCFPWGDQDDVKQDDYWVNCQSLLPHATILLEHRFKFYKMESDLQKATLLLSTGHYIEWDEPHDENVKRGYKESLELCQRHLGSDHPSTWASMGHYFRSVTHIDAVYPPNIDSNKVAEMGHALVSHYREVSGPRHVDTISSMSSMAQFLHKEGKFDESEIMQRQALKISEEVLGHADDQTLACMEKLARTLEATGRFEEAVEIRKDCINTDTELVGQAHRWVMNGKHNLAICLEKAGRLDEAISLNREIMTLREAVLGRDHFETLSTARNLAYALYAGRRYEEARDILDHILNVIKDGKRVYHAPLITAQEIIELRSEFEEERDQLEP
ncbi:hypothetical protein KVR01_007704 [Diaporthe batatas]|uniref:uncharacterized protein n=1 Tax=Diaporthe batatas TaxID=748121 RepID=UPI001D03F4B5|nr:uncharacterized protein KVR01_007704 [Diaporthe batatas]KAG8161939.1 hypothetical protein KVR01_007704 [Diaporthe batatas]